MSKANDLAKPKTLSTEEAERRDAMRFDFKEKFREAAAAARKSTGMLEEPELESVAAPERRREACETEIILNLAFDVAAAEGLLEDSTACAEVVARSALAFNQVSYMLMFVIAQPIAKALVRSKADMWGKVKHSIADEIRPEVDFWIQKFLPKQRGRIPGAEGILARYDELRRELRAKDPRSFAQKARERLVIEGYSQSEDGAKQAIARERRLLRKVVTKIKPPF